MYALGCSIGESKVNVYDYAVVGELEGNGDGLGLRRGWKCGCSLLRGGGAESEDG